MFVVPSLLVMFSSIVLPAGDHVRDRRSRFDVRQTLGITAACDARVAARVRPS